MEVFKSNTSELNSDDIKIVIRTFEYFKDLKVHFSDQYVYFCSIDDVFQIIYNRSPFDIFSICVSSNKEELNLLFNKIKNVLNGLAIYIVTKPKSKEAKVLKSVIDLCITENDLTWVHIAARLSIMSVFKTQNVEVCHLLNNQNNQAKLTPLMIAIKSERLDLIKAILSFDPDILVTDRMGNNVLHLASTLANNIFSVILKHCYLKPDLASFEAKNLESYTPLHVACYNNKLSNVFEFLKLSLPIHFLIVEPYSRYKISNSSQEQFDKETDEIEKKILFTMEQLTFFDTKDIKYGGSPLHWCKNKKMITKLLTLFPIDSINSLHEIPLHVMTRNKRLECVVPLLHFGSPVDIQNFSKQTPLHLAIIAKDIKIVEALIVFDCNVNLLDGNNKSARHLAASNKSVESQTILYLLHSFGANRCPASQTDCTDGCSSTGNSNGIPLPNWPSFEKSSVYNEILFFDIIKYDQLNLKNNNLKTVNMICLDGGGTRGLNSIQILIEIQKFLSNPIENYFHWIGGTSTGSIIGSSITLKKSLKQIRHEYFVLKDDILNPKKPHNSETLDNILKKYFGENVKLSSLSYKNLLITSVLADRDPAKLHIFRSYSTNYFDSSNLVSQKDLNLLPDPVSYDQVLVWEACRASCAAPFFFRPSGPFLDGGLIANNPTLDCMTEFFKYNKFLKYDQKFAEIKRLNLILSIGTGRSTQTPVDIFDLSYFGFRKNPVKAFKTAIKLLSIGEFLTKLITQADDHIVERAQSWCASIKVPYFRINPILPEKISFDERDDKKIIEGLYFTKLYMLHLKPKINFICQLLEDFKYSSS